MSSAIKTVVRSSGKIIGTFVCITALLSSVISWRKEILPEMKEQRSALKAKRKKSED